MNKILIVVDMQNDFVSGSLGTAEARDIIDELKPYVKKVIDKPTFGSTELVEYLKTKNYDSFELCGLCTDICVVSNALLIKANFYEAEVSVDSACCAGVTVNSHNSALETMKMCQIEVK